MTTSVPNVKEIVRDYLQRNGFDGLCLSTDDCGCRLADLMPCGSPCDLCLPGYLGRSEDGSTIIVERRKA